MEKKARLIYVHQDDDGCILGIYGTLNKAHKNLNAKKFPIHRSFAVFKRWFDDSRVGGQGYYEVSGSGALQSREVI